MKKDNTLRELIVGIIFLGVVIQIVCLIVSKDYLYNAIGLWSGIAIACFSAIHMKRSIEDALDLGEKSATKHVRGAYVKRMLISVVIMGVVIYFNLGNPITMLIGVFPLKLAAYLTPYTHKLFLRFSNRKDNEKLERGG